MLKLSPLMLCSAVAFAAPPPVPKVAVLTVHAEHGVSQGSANLLLEVLVTDIQQSGKYQVISSSDLAAMLGFERQKQLVGCTEESCLAEVGSALGADWLLDTSVGTIGNLRVLALKLLDVKSGMVKRRETETLPDDNALVESGRRLVAKLFDLPAAASKGTSARTVVGIGALAAGVGLTAAGIAFGVKAQSQLNTYQTSGASPDANAARGSANLADGLYLGAVVVGVVGAVLLLTGHSNGGGAAQ